MPEIPECLNRRYIALDELIDQLSTMTSRQSHEECYEPNNNDPGIKLMCDFWNILKEDPDCNLTQAVKQRMGLNTSSYVFKPQRVSCYMAENCRHNKRNERNANDRRNEVMNRIKHIRCENESKSGAGKTCCSKSPSGNVLPLSKVLCNLNEAASFDKKCNARISDLMETQKVLKEQITQLENREKEGVQLLKQADCMWSCMEESYKKRIAESLERQKELLKELREVEKSNTKWRRNRKELEMQVKQLAKCHQDILDKITQKSNDIKCMDLEIADFKKRIESHKKEAEGSKKALNIKKQQSDKRMANISAELSTLTKKLAEEKQCKCNKEKEGEKYVKEAREDLQKICKVLIQKKLESEDLKAERDAALSEIELIKQTCSQCQDRCKKKQESINDEIKRINEEIKTFKVRCIQCHQCTDTEDARKFCNDCPKCMGERECINADDHCDKDPTMDCVCMSVKQKFLDNVFENMYTVLERQSRTRPGKAVANSIVSCLKNSRNGKLNADTRQILQDFILNTVKRNLNLTIIGGAVKTRCEMDADTYKQLMTCLKQVKAAKPKKADKSTPAKKDSCRRWGGSSECNCPGDAKSCVCSKRAPPPPRDPDPCPPLYEEPKPDPSQIIACPHKESTSCGPDCAKQGTSGVGTDISAWKRDPCSEAACPFSTNMRAAQCVLGPELLNSAVKSYSSPTPYIPEDLQNIMITCKCGNNSNKLCKCRADVTSQPRERIIEEVMGRFNDVTPIEKVLTVDEWHDEIKLKRNTKNECACNKTPNGNTIKNISQLCDCSSSFILIEGTDALVNMLHRKNMTLVGRPDYVNKTSVKLFPNPNSNMFKKDFVNKEVNVILGPQFRPHKTKKYDKSNSANSFKLPLNDRTIAERTAVGNYTNSKSLDTDVYCNSMKKLFKSVIASDNGEEGNYYPGVKLITMNSLINLLSLKTRKISEENSEKNCNKTLDAKQLKAEVVKNVNNSCSKQLGNVINRRNSLTERKLRGEVNMSQKKIAQDQVFNKAEKFIDNGVSKQNRGFVPRKDKNIKIQKHMVARASNTNSKADDITFLTNAPSEILAIELDDETIDMIDKKTIEDPNIIVALNKTASGHIAVNFNSEDDAKNSYRISVKRNPSGTRLLKMNKDIFNKLQSIDDNRREEESNILQNIIPDKVDNVKNLHNIGIEKQKIVHNKLSEAHERNSPTINKDIKIKLQEIYSDKRSIAVKIEKENSTIVLEEIEAPLRKTLSGNIAVDLCRYQGILSDDITKLILKERAIFLKRSNSGALILNTTSSVNTAKANIKQSASGAFLLVINESIPQIDGTIAIKTSKEKFYKLKIKSANDELTEPPAVLKLTPSNNYVVIPDKEYESRYNDVIHHILEDDTEYYTSVTRESDDSIVIDFEDIFEPNAFLVRTKSGCCKIVQALKKHDSVDSTRKKISDTVYDLLDKMPKTNKNSKDNIINKPIVTNQPTKSISDSHLYRNSYNADTKGLLAQPHALIKKTYSGKYAVVLDKESKNSFIKNLRSYLENNSYGKVPVRKTEDGDIIIVLNGDLQEKSNYGALKITSSGNIYVTIDEEVVKNLGIVDYKYASAMNNNSNSIHLIEKLSNPVNKGVTTTCNAKPETCGCDISKCVCSEIRFDKFDWTIQNSMGKEIDTELYGADWNKMKKISNSSIQICDPKFCMETCNSNARINNIIRTKVSHIRQSESKSAADKKSHSEQCYYVIEAVYPHRMNWFEAVSNKTPMIPKFNDKTTENYETDKENEHVETKSNISENTSIAPDPKKIDNLDENWDSLSYLPPQLPEFLQGINYPLVS